MSYRPKSSEEIRRNMSAIRSADTQPEMKLRRELHRIGLRFRLHARDLPGRPDIIFRPERVAIFVDGDFWHARALRERGPTELRASIRTQNREYWVSKFTKRVARDDEVTRQLIDLGWSVVRFWESDLLREVSECARLVERELRSRRRLRSRTR